MPGSDQVAGVNVREQHMDTVPDATSHCPGVPEEERAVMHGKHTVLADNTSPLSLISESIAGDVIRQHSEI